MRHGLLASAALIASVISTTAVNAAHNNPWAGPDDTVLAKKHDTNQAKKPGTGQDEMRGDQAQTGAERDGNRGQGAADHGGAGHGGGHGGNGRGQ